MSAALTRLHDAITGPRGVWWSMAGAIALLGVLRWLLLPNASQDDAEQLLFAQTWQGGYNPAQPPLYTWLVNAAESVFGAGLFPVLLVKFACLFALLAFLYLGAREVLADRRHAALAALSPLGLYYVSYDAVLNYSNTVMMAAACAATFWALAALRRDGRAVRYAALGAVVGIGLLAKFGYMAFAAALLAAALCDRPLRARLLNARTLLTLAVAGLVVLPHMLWWLGGAADIAEAARDRLSLARRVGYWEGVGRGLAKLANAVVNFAMPLVVVLAIVFPRAFWRTGNWSGDALAWKRLFERFALFALAIIVAGVLAAGVTEVRTHYMFILLLMPVYALLRVETAPVKAIAPPAFAAILAGLVATVAVVLVAKHFTDPMWCRKCYFHYPYPELADGLREAGFEGGTVVAHFHRIQIGGNLRIEMPRARVVSTKYPYYMPPRRGADGQCLLLWDAQYFDAIPEELADFVAPRLGVDVANISTSGTVKAPMMHSDREWGLGYALMPGSGSCR